MAWLAGFAILATTAATTAARADVTLLNVSYDPTRELYKAINAAFAADWKTKTGETVTIQNFARRLRRPGARGDRRARGRRRDAGARRRHRRDRRQDRQDPGRLAEAAAEQFGALHVDDRVPRAQGQSQGHPRLGRSREARRFGRSPPIPKTSGGARWNYLAAWAYGEKKFGGDEAKTKDFVAAIYKNAPVLDTGARGSTITFAQRGLGDVLIAWENDAFLASEEFGKDQFEIVAPSLSILAEPPVSVVDANVDAKGARKQAEAYLQFLYSPAAQAIIAKNYFRPAHPEFADPARSQALSHAQPRHRRRRLRRLEEGAGDPFRRRRCRSSVPVGLELELSKMSPEDRAEFEREMGVGGTDRDRLIHTILDVSRQMTFFTAGTPEVRTWLLRKGGTALEAAGGVTPTSPGASSAPK